MPIGPEHWTPERVGFADSAASALELVTVLGCCALLADNADHVGACRTIDGGR